MLDPNIPGFVGLLMVIISIGLMIYAFKNGHDAAMIWGVGAWLAGWALIFFASYLQDTRYYTTYMKECMDDGKKEYECAALFPRGRTHIVPMPVIISR